jgi:hypothetical protein
MDVFAVILEIADWVKIVCVVILLGYVVIRLV